MKTIFNKEIEQQSQTVEKFLNLNNDPLNKNIFEGQAVASRKLCGLAELVKE